MKPIPVAFHIGPLELHTYGIGLAITFWFAYRYYERRLRARGFPTDWVGGLFLWIIVSAVVGARVLHVLSHATYYWHHAIDIPAVWQGGLSSFGGLLFAIPTGLFVARRRCPELGTLRALDIIAPVLAASWAIGRLLGPQLMVAGGGHPTHQWFGMYYADQVGKRLPVPIFQSLEDFAVFGILLLVERRLARWPDGSPRTGYPAGAVLGVTMVLWGVERTVDEHLWLSYPGHLGSVLVQLAGVGLVLSGLVLLVVTRQRWRAWQSTAGDASPGVGPAGGEVGTDAADVATAAASLSEVDRPEVAVADTGAAGARLPRGLGRRHPLGPAGEG